jgi:preprotein translocase subunit YajC
MQSKNLANISIATAVGLGLSLVSLGASAEATSGSAATAVNNAAAAGSPLGSGLGFLVVVVMMYCLMIRPQNKRAKEPRELVNKIAKGDEVLISGGILGVVEKIKDNLAIIKVSEGVTLTVQKQAIAAAMPKGTMQSLN